MTNATKIPGVGPPYVAAGNVRTYFRFPLLFNKQFLVQAPCTLHLSLYNIQKLYDGHAAHQDHGGLHMISRFW